MSSRLVLVLIACVAAGCERAPSPVPRKVTPDARMPAPVEPIDLMFAIDLSKSMEETDLPPDRLGAAKDVVRRFVASNHRDRIGLVIYGQQPKLIAPLTGDSKLLDRTIAKLEIGDVPELGTATGDGLALAVEQLRDSRAKHRVVIVLADGDTNWVKDYSPEQAAELARRLGIEVDTVLVGDEKAAADFGGMSVDPAPLRAIAATTGGAFYTGSDVASLESALQDVRARLAALAK